MPVIDLGSVVGPQGPQGATGATGAQGLQGNPGPNQVTNQTSTNLVGVLQGAASKVTTKAVDASPTASSDNLVSSGGVFNAIQDVAGRISTLWTNANTSTAFEAQTLTLNLSSYDLVIIECLPERTLVSTKISYICRVGGDAEIIQGMYLPSGTTVPMIYQRQVQAQTNGIVFGDGLEKQASATARTTNNNAIHPRAIYGIKV